MIQKLLCFFTNNTALITLNEIGEQALPHKELALAAAGLNVSLWIVLISFPFVQVMKKVAIYQFWGTHVQDHNVIQEIAPSILGNNKYMNRFCRCSIILAMHARTCFSHKVL